MGYRVGVEEGDGFKDFLNLGFSLSVNDGIVVRREGGFHPFVYQISKDEELLVREVDGVAHFKDR